jgi:predicted acylesterase/phospholipase RssA
VAFSSGGFDTAMDLGVIHALLVIQGKAPHAAVGISAGAVHAVALAEVLQRLDPGKGGAVAPEQQQRARVARFRELLEAFANAPAELAAAYLPDTLQIEAGRSLEPVRLPIHSGRERRGRDEHLRARQGFIRFFNFLLRTRLSFATLTRFVRRCLGLRAAGQIKSPSARGAIWVFEVLRSWSLIGANLHRAAGLVLEVVWRPLFRIDGRRRGATAAHLLFARRWFHGLGVAAVYSVAFTVLAALWLSLTGVPVLVVWELRTWLAGMAPERMQMTLAILAGVVTAAIILFEQTGVWRQLTVTDRSPRRTLFKELALEIFEILSLVTLFLGVPLALIFGGLLLTHGLSPSAAWTALRPILRWAPAAIVLLGLVPLAVVVARYGAIHKDYRRRFLDQFDLADSLLSKHPLRDKFVQLFDPEYYGPRNMNDVVERSLKSEDRPSETNPDRKLVRDYDDPEKAEPIAVGMVVANVGTGDLEIVDGAESVVDGLYAATAVAPLLPPAETTGRLHVDGANISSEPTAGALALLRGRIEPYSPVIHIYSVSPLPFSSPTLRDRETDEAPLFFNLVHVARRAFQLQRFRDASMERRLTELHTRTMTAGQGAQTFKGKTYLRAWVTPVEPDQPLEVNQRLVEARTKEEKRDVIAEAVAEGCRAALQVMIRATQRAGVAEPQMETFLPCREALQSHFANSGVSPLPILAALDPQNPPPNQNQSGLPEVCKHCRVVRRIAGGKTATLPHRLRFRTWQEVGPSWPHQDAPTKPLEGDPHFVREESEYAKRTVHALRKYKEALDLGTDEHPRWPRIREGQEGTVRPVVSLLFSGGVFRGVFQLGTLNALSELGLRPDVVAGASVGSITSAMIAQALSFPARGNARHLAIARLAASYLALDRLIITDRFADFIRGLTLRAGATRFSLSDADRFFRRYDAPSPDRYNRAARRVMAGLERLFWLSPFELHSLVRALRLGDSAQVSSQLTDYVQEWLERMGVGREMLGSEPLALLVAEHVLQPLPSQQGPIDSHLEPFNRFLREGIYFLATATNLSMGRLEVLGEQQFDPDGLRPVLLEGLLASSAFPAVFRPRWSWEVTPGSNVRHQYIDGGVMDNLPLDAVAHFLVNASQAGLINPLPTWKGKVAPHLLFSASLEVDVPRVTEIAGVERFRRDWIALRGRAAKLRYNRKIELYAETQATLRAMRAANRPNATLTPIDLEVVTVTPRWLVGTFAFHPMLGFRRYKQARSIAHGCASTLAVFSDLLNDPVRSAWLVPWGVDTDAVPANVYRSNGNLVPETSVPRGACWFRPDRPCPFSRNALEALAPALPEQTVAELDGIYRACGRESTHRAQD